MRSQEAFTPGMWDVAQKLQKYGAIDLCAQFPFCHSSHFSVFASPIFDKAGLEDLDILQLLSKMIKRYLSHRSRITEWFRLKGNARSQLAYFLCSRRATYSRLCRTRSRQILSVSKYIMFTAFLGNLCQCLATITVKTFLYVQIEHPVFQFVHTSLFCHWAPLKGRWLPHLYNLPSDIYTLLKLSLGLLQAE